MPCVKITRISLHLRHIFSPQPSGSAIVFSSLTNFVFLTQSHQRDNLQRNKEKDRPTYILVAAHPARKKDVIQTPLEVRLHVWFIETGLDIEKFMILTWILRKNFQHDNHEA